jgi:hypothetical protein
MTATIDSLLALLSHDGAMGAESLPSMLGLAVPTSDALDDNLEAGVEQAAVRAVDEYSIVEKLLV